MSSTAKTDLSLSVRSYLDGILASARDAKVLLLDSFTTSAASLVYSQSELLQRGVVLIESLQSRAARPPDAALSALHCVCVVRPTPQNVRDLCQELNCPHFGAYSLFFTNTVAGDALRQIAFADHSSRVGAVHEVFIDHLVVNRRVFSLGMPRAAGDARRAADGLFSVLAAARARAAIRCDAGSELCRAVGAKLQKKIDANADLFRAAVSNALLLVTDRRTDPLAPLLHAWSYQALIHEFLGIDDNVVRLSGDKSVVLDERSDAFFAENLYLDFGSLGGAIQGLQQNARAQTSDVRDVKDIDALKKFIHNYPISQRRMAIAAKHSEIGGIISNRVKEEGLFELCQFEQSLAVDENQEEHFRRVMEYAANPETTNENALRVALLYCARYLGTDNNRIDEIMEELKKRNGGGELGDMVDKFVNWLPKNDRAAERKSIFSKAISFMRNDDKRDAFRRYSPFLKKLIEKQFKELPYVTIKDLPQNSEINQIIVFFVGGVTYEEASYAYNQEITKSLNADLIIGGTTIHNMRSFVYNEIN